MALLRPFSLRKPVYTATRYSGTDTYRYIDPLIRNNDKELMIISPYLSAHYAKMLAKVARKKHVRIITSENPLRSKSSFLRALRDRPIASYARVILYFTILEAIVVYARLFLWIIGVVTLLLAATVVLFISRVVRLYEKIEIKTTGEDFVHEKMYITNSLVITGSANLTYNGTHKNLEHIEMIRNRKEIEELKSHFNALWGRY